MQRTLSERSTTGRSTSSTATSSYPTHTTTKKLRFGCQKLNAHHMEGRKPTFAEPVAGKVSKTKLQHQAINMPCHSNISQHKSFLSASAALRYPLQAADGSSRYARCRLPGTINVLLDLRKTAGLKWTDILRLIHNLPKNMIMLQAAARYEPHGKVSNTHPANVDLAAGKSLTARRTPPHALCLVNCQE